MIFGNEQSTKQNAKIYLDFKKRLAKIGNYKYRQ